MKINPCVVWVIYTEYTAQGKKIESSFQWVFLNKLLLVEILDIFIILKWFCLQLKHLTGSLDLKVLLKVIGLDMLTLSTQTFLTIYSSVFALVNFKLILLHERLVNCKNFPSYQLEIWQHQFDNLSFVLAWWRNLRNCGSSWKSNSKGNHYVYIICPV